MPDHPETHAHYWRPSAAAGGITVVLLHGTGGDERDLVPLAERVAPGAALLGVRGNVLEHGARRFFRRLAEGVFDLEDLRVRTEALAAFLEGARQRYAIAPSTMYALGFSNGANIAASLLLTHPGALAGAALVRAMIPFEPSEAVDLAARPVLLSQGRSDPLVPVETGERLGALLRARGAKVELAWQVAAHAVVPGDVTVLEEWFRTRGT